MSGRVAVALVSLSLLPAVAAGTHAELRRQAEEALRRAMHFFRTEVSTHGGYLWRYSEDLALREGERPATATMVWVQPPGTPSVGTAYLWAYRATGHDDYLDAARQTAYALVQGQLRSGGWEYQIEFDPELRKQYAYRVDGGSEQRRNATTLDDNTTQAALRLLMRVDEALGFNDAAIHEAARYGLDTLVRAQYPNGAWPQRYERFPDPRNFKVKRASYPQTWSRTHPGTDYRNYYTFNDNTISDCIETMLEAARTYGSRIYRESAEKGGRFILLAQMPEPQPAWAQQYDAEMHPAWARRFEPPAVSGGESLGVMRTLLLLYRKTGNRGYLEPLPRAIAYLRRSRLADGRLARFYELETNRPLFFTRDYRLTYSDDDLPTHYAFKVPGRIEPVEDDSDTVQDATFRTIRGRAWRGDELERIAREYQQLKAKGRTGPERQRQPMRPQLTDKLVERARRVIAALDERGRWVEIGLLRAHQGTEPRRIIDTETFIRNFGVLTEYFEATRSDPEKD